MAHWHCSATYWHCSGTGTGSAPAIIQCCQCSPTHGAAPPPVVPAPHTHKSKATTGSPRLTRPPQQRGQSTWKVNLKLENLNAAERQVQLQVELQIEAQVQVDSEVRSLAVRCQSCQCHGALSQGFLKLASWKRVPLAVPSGHWQITTASHGITPTMLASWSRTQLKLIASSSQDTTVPVGYRRGLG